MRDHTHDGRRRGRPRRRVLLVAAAAGGLLIAGGGLAAVAQDAHDVEVVDDQFSPATITIEEGDTVRWTQSGSNPHTVTADDGSFDSHPTCPADCMGPGDTYEQTFDEPGEFGYHCTLHGSAGSGMHGTVVVTAAEDDPEPEPEPEAEPEEPELEAAPEEPEADPEPDPEPEDGEPDRDEGDAETATADETLPETGSTLLSLALMGLLALGLGALWLRRTHTVDR